MNIYPEICGRLHDAAYKEQKLRMVMGTTPERFTVAKKRKVGAKPLYALNYMAWLITNTKSHLKLVHNDIASKIHSNGEYITVQKPSYWKTIFCTVHYLMNSGNGCIVPRYMKFNLYQRDSHRGEPTREAIIHAAFSQYLETNVALKTTNALWSAIEKATKQFVIKNRLCDIRTYTRQKRSNLAV